MCNMPDQLPIQIDRTKLEAFCRRYPVRRLSLFGSVIHGDFRPDSDVDVLVEFHSDAQIGYLKLVQMQMELEQIIGRSVDLRTPNELSRYFRDQVMREALVQYAA